MKKYIVGAFFGFVLTFTISAHAADITSIIGKAVQGVFPVTVNGDTLPKTAIVIDGTSYLPVRVIGDAIGYDVSFNADLGIELKKKEVVPMSSVTQVTTTEALATTVTDTVYTESEIDLRINGLNNFINMMQMSIASSPPESEIAKLQDELKGYQDQLAIWEARKAALQ